MAGPDDDTLTATRVRYRLLGPLAASRTTVDGADEPIDLGSPKQRAVLAFLLLHRGRVVGTDRLIDAVWPDEAPPRATASLQAYVSNLRRALRDPAGATSPIVRRAPGYTVAVRDEDVDAGAFVADATAARAAADGERWAPALELADRALAAWTGAVLGDLGDEPWIRAAAHELEELRRETRETRVTALLAEARIAPALAEAQVLRAEQPHRDRGCWLLMVALHRAGRSPEALDAYREHAARLDEKLGLEPGAELRELQVGILRQDPELAAWPRSPGWTGATPVVAPATGGRAAGGGGGAPGSASGHGHAGPHDDGSGASVTALGRAPGRADDLGPGTGLGPDGAEDAADALVGRARESALLDRIATEVAGGAVRWLVLTGPAGIGKTRLAEELAGRIRRAGGREAWARCPEEDGSPAWWPIRQMVRALGGDPDVVLVPPAGVDSDAARFAVYERLVELVEGASDDPVAIVVDDVQWADPTSTRCLAYLAGALRGLPVAFVVTLRDGEDDTAVQPLLTALARADGHRQVAVGPLGADDVRTLADRIAGAPLDAAEAERLSERTGGNPLFVSEYARLAPDERAGDGIPLAVRSVLGRRLGGLEPAVLQVLRAAAVIGDVLDLELLAATTRLDREDLADLLDDAADERIVVAAPGTGGYAFAHGLLREEVLAQIPALRRQRLHAKVAAVLCEGGRAEPSRRAQHLLLALPLADPAEVLDACRAAAEDAAQRWSSETAADWWASALHAFDLLPPASRPAHERDGLLVARVEALARAGRGQTVLDVVDAGLLDAVREGRTSAAGRLAASLLRAAGAWPWVSYGSDPGPLLARLAGIEPFVADDPAAHARVLAALAVGSCYAPDQAVPESLSARAIAIAEPLGDDDVLADALMGRLLTFSGVSAHSEEGLELVARIASLPHPQARVDGAIGHAVASMAALNLGDVEGAADHLRRGIAATDLLRLPAVRAQLRWMEGVLAEWRGDLGEAGRQYATAAQVHEQTELYTSGSSELAVHTLRRELGTLADAEDDGAVEPVAWAAAIAAARGERVRAAELVEQWLVVDRPTVWNTLGHQALLAHVVADLGLSGPAARLLGDLEPHAGRIANIGQVGMVGSVDLALARLFAALDCEPEARDALGEAEDQARRTGGRPTLLRCRLLAAELDARLGRDVRADAAEVAADADRLGMAGVAAAARALAVG